MGRLGRGPHPQKFENPNTLESRDPRHKWVVVPNLGTKPTQYPPPSIAFYPGWMIQRGGFRDLSAEEPFHEGELHSGLPYPPQGNIGSFPIGPG